MPHKILISLLCAVSMLATERPVTPPVHGPAASVQYDAAVASDGDGYLAIWTDKRATRPELRGTRIARDGHLLDPTGFLIVTDDFRQPVVTWSGTSYIVAWGTSQGNMKVVRIDRDGAIHDVEHLASATPTSIASNGSHVVIAYLSNAGFMYGLVLTPDGEIAGSVRFPFTPTDPRGPRIAANGSTFAAVWTSFAQRSIIEAVRFDANGLIDTAPRMVKNDPFAFDPHIASDGNSFVLLSRDSLFASRVSALHLNADLTPEGSSVMLPEAAFRSSASLLWTGTHYAVVGDSAYTISSLRLGRDAQLLDSAAITVESAATTGTGPTPAIATNGDDVLIAWSGAFAFDSQISSDTSIDVYGTFVSASTLQREARALLSVSARKESYPAIASGGTNLLAVWSDASGLYVKRFAPDGSDIDATPLRLHDKPAIATVVFNGTDYLVAWYDVTYNLTTINTVMVRRVARNGALRADGGGALVVRPDDRSIAAASNGKTTLLVMGAMVSRLAADGSFLDSVPLKLTEAIVGGVDVSADDRGRFLVTWGEMDFVPPYFETPQPARVRAARITESLANINPGGLPVAEGGAGDPSVAWNGREWLVVWSSGALRGRIVSADGLLAGNDSFIANSALRPDVAWDGARYIVAWHATAGFGNPHPIHIAWLPELGLPFVSDRIVGESDIVSFTRVSLAPLGPGAVAASYARIAGEPQYGGVTRAFVNVMNPATSRRRAVR